MIHEILPVGILQCNCSILGDEASRSAIVVDPGDNIAQIMDTPVGTVKSRLFRARRLMRRRLSDYRAG